MKRRIVLVVTALALVALLVSAVAVMAAKPQNSGSGKDVIALSNGFPSGQHFNLNIHGKDPETFSCNDTPGGKSVFVAEYGNATIQYVSNKKASVYDLTVLDPCAMPEPYGDGVAKVQLPYQVLVDDEPTPAGGYYVFARILGKPNNAKIEPSSNIILYPNTVVEACNDPGDPEFGNYTACSDSELLLGLIVGENIYVPDPENQQLYRFEDPIPTKGRGKSRAVDITRLFTYTGWVVDARLDIGNSTGGCSGNMTNPEPDGKIDDCDVPTDAWAIIEGAGIDPNLYDDHPLFGDDSDSIEIEEWLAYNADLVPPMAWYFANHWIFDIADLVITEQGLENDGTKLVQIRFYPVVTTTFGSHIIVEKQAPDGGLTAFGFEPSYGNAFSLRDGETKDSGALKAGNYTVTEILPLSGNWTLDQIEIIDLDPSTDSSANVSTQTVTIDLASGETVRVIFHNEPTPQP
jgi:hypothetical protein